MNKRALIVGGVVLVVVAALVALLAWPRGADPVSEEDALESFREQGSADSTGDEATEDPSAAIPTPGVYRYAGSGSETVQLGPIPAETRQFPAEINGVVTSSDPNSGEPCFITTLNLIEQHTEDSTYCRTADGGLRLEHYEKHQQVSAFKPTVDIRCDPGVLWDPGTPELPLECSLELLGGPKKVVVEFSGTSTATEGETRGLDGTEREVVTLFVHFDLEGSVSGTWDEILTFTVDDTLLVGIERLLHLEGFASFLEDISYELSSATPAR
jgi:hypothetical protein